MTTSVIQPYTNLVGDGSKQTFTYYFPIVETLDLIVKVDDVQMVEYSHYIVQNLTENGGEVVFAIAPVSGADVLIGRRTTISQQVDYTESPFPVQSHEDQLDKTIYILQELLSGLFYDPDTIYGSDGEKVVITFDLSVTTGVTNVTINNSGGTDAILPAWTSGEKAGVFRGEITTTPPEDGAVTTHDDGHVWIEVAP